MGIQDRGYYQEGTAQLVARDRAPTVLGIVVFTTVCFILQSIFPDAAASLRLYPGDAFRPWQLLTSVFLHGGVGHLFFNMLIFWWLGRDVERLYGAGDLVFFYLLSGTVAGMAYVLSAPDAIPALGASGAVMGVVVLCTLYYPTRPILIWFILPAPLWAMTCLYILVDVTGALQFQSTGIAHMAHLGGAATGLLYRYVDLRISRLLPKSWTADADATPNRRRLRVSSRRAAVRASERVPGQAGKPGAPPVERLRPEDLSDEALAKSMDRLRMDELLDKVHREGRDALTSEESEFLDAISRKLRDRPE